jgi:hypothetical protein
MLGTRQTGLLQFKVADLMRDADLLPAVRDAAQACWSAGRPRQPAARPLAAPWPAIRPSVTPSRYGSAWRPGWLYFAFKESGYRP